MWFIAALLAAGVLGPVEVVGPFPPDLSVRAPSELNDLAVFEGQSHPVAWHVAAEDGTIDLAEVVNLRREGVVHLRARIELKETSAVRFDLRSDGAWRSALDGAALASGSGHHPESPSSRSLRWLEPGPHRIDVVVLAAPGRSWLELGGLVVATGAPRPLAYEVAAERPWVGLADRWAVLRAAESPRAKQALARFEHWRGVGPSPPPADPRYAPEHPEAWIAKGDERCATGDGAGAARGWRKALQYDPSRDDLRGAVYAIEQPGLEPLVDSPPRRGACVPPVELEADLPPGVHTSTVVELRPDGSSVRLWRMRGGLPGIPPVSTHTGYPGVACPPALCGPALGMPAVERSFSRQGADEAPFGALVPVWGPGWVYEVRVPAGWPLHWDARGIAGPDRRRAGDVDVYRWSAPDAPPLRHEPGAPALSVGDPYLAYSVFPDWGAAGAAALADGGPGLLVRSHRRGWLPDVPVLGAFDVRIGLEAPVPPELLGAEALRVEASGRTTRLRLEGRPPVRERRARLERDGGGKLVEGERATPVTEGDPPWPLRVVERHARLGRRIRPRVSAPEHVRWILELPGGAAPPPAVVESRFGRYERARRQTPDGWVVERTLELVGGEIAPGVYPEWRDFLVAVDAADRAGW